jgi:Fic family protein
LDKETVHFEGPAGERVEEEMNHLLQWIERDKALDWVLQSAIAHLWFVTIHPFEDGNGRVGRALADMLLARSEGSPQRFYSLSSQIQKERKAYYEVLEATQKGDLHITAWLQWYLNCLHRAIDSAQSELAAVLRKSRFWEQLGDMEVNERQRSMIGRLLDGIEGKLTSSKWAKMTKCSQDTASRDISDLIARGLLKKSTAGGRSTSYTLVYPDE